MSDENTAENTEESTEENTPEVLEVSIEEKQAQAKEKFVEYETICEEEKQLDDMMAAVRKRKSDVVQDIEGLIGKGPFEYKGEELVITKRKDTFYFRMRGRTNVTVIG